MSAWTLRLNCYRHFITRAFKILRLLPLAIIIDTKWIFSGFLDFTHSTLYRWRGRRGLEREQINNVCVFAVSVSSCSAGVLGTAVKDKLTGWSTVGFWVLLPLAYGGSVLRAQPFPGFTASMRLAIWTWVRKRPDALQSSVLSLFWWPSVN